MLLYFYFRLFTLKLHIYKIRRIHSRSVVTEYYYYKDAKIYYRPAKRQLSWKYEIAHVELFIFLNEADKEPQQRTYYK